LQPRSRPVRGSGCNPVRGPDGGGPTSRQAEIGVIPAASPRTIDKHMERILARLGLENRAARLLQAGEVLRPAR
jgi:hypothetical protein